MAIANATRQLADSGLQYVDYESGWRNHVDVAVRRAVMTGVSQINQQYAVQSMEYLNTEYVEVSAHAGARNTGVGFQNHESWQGRIYRWKKYTRQFPNASSGNYKDFEETCGLGDVQGIHGANCRHWYSPFIEGVMEPTYSEEQLNALKAENNLTVFEGKVYDGYQSTQVQRTTERAIRKAKRERAAFKEAGFKEDEQAYSIRLRRLNEKYNEFSEAAGLRKQPERMNAGYSAELTDIKRFAPLKDYDGDFTIKDKFSERQYVIDIGKPRIAGASQHFWENLETKADRSGLNLEAAQDIIDNSKLALYQTDRRTIKFIAETGYTVVNANKQVITVVPEKIRKKYRDYLEGK